MPPPVIPGAFAAIGDIAENAAKKLVEPFKNVAKLIGALGDVMKTALGPALLQLGKLALDISKSVYGVLEPALKAVGSAFKAVSAVVALPAVAVLGAAKKLGESFDYLVQELVIAGASAYGTSATFRSLVDGIASVGKWVGGLLPNMDKLGERLQDFYKGVGVTTGSIAVGAGIAVGALVGLGKTMETFVSKANPGAILLFNMAVDDLMAIIGQALVPIFLLITELIRTAADTLSTFAMTIGNAIAGALRPFVEVLKVVFEVVGRVGQMIGKAAEALAPALAAVGEVLLAVFKAIQPVLDLVVNLIGGALAGVLGLLADVVQAVVPYVVALVEVFGLMLKTVVGWVRDLLSLIGVSIPDTPGTKPGSSVGASVKSTQVGSVESYIQSAQTKAFALGTAGGSDPTTRTASAAEAMRVSIDAIKEKILNMPSAIWNQFKDWANGLLKVLNPFGGESYTRSEIAATPGGAAAYNPWVEARNGLLGKFAGYSDGLTPIGPGDLAGRAP